ncbi:hypothetical protein Tco_0546231 [Tanacetum coccineum]
MHSTEHTTSSKLSVPQKEFILFKPSREEKYVPNKVRASVRTNPITVSQPHVVTKKEVNSDSNGLSSTGVDNTAKTRRPQPRSNTKNDRVIQSCLWCALGCSKHNGPGTKLLINFIWKFLGTVRFRNDHTAAVLGFGDLQWGNILITRVYFNDREDIGKLGAKGDIGFFIGYSADSSMAFEQSIQNPGYKSMTSGQIIQTSFFTYAPSTITTQKPTEGDLDLLFEAMYDDFIGGQPSSAPRTAPAAQAPQVLQTPTATTTTADTTPTPIIASSQATNFSNTSQDVDELHTHQHVQHQPATIADNVPNAMFDENTFVNPFATPSTCDADSPSSQYVDPSNMHTFYQPYPHEFQWTKDHPLEPSDENPRRPV